MLNLGFKHSCCFIGAVNYQYLRRALPRYACANHTKGAGTSYDKLAQAQLCSDDFNADPRASMYDLVQPLARLLLLLSILCQTPGFRPIAVLLWSEKRLCNYTARPSIRMLDSTAVFAPGLAGELCICTICLPMVNNAPNISFKPNQLHESIPQSWSVKP